MTLRTDLPTASSTQTSPEPRRSRARLILAAAVVGLVAAGGIGLALRGTGAKHRLEVMLGIAKPRPLPPVPPPVVKVPAILETIPADCSTGIDPAAPILIKLDLPNGPIDTSTVTDDSVGLFRFDNRQRIPAKVTIEGAQIRVTPAEPLESHHNYRLHLLPGVADVTGKPLKQRTLAFFTSSQPPAGVAFEKVLLPITKGDGFTCLNFGPDGKLYGSTHDGRIMRFTVAVDGTLSGREVFTTLHQAEGGPRLVTGFTFDPQSTADAPVIYLTHSEFGFGPPGPPVTDFTGKIARLSGADLSKLETLVVNLPRSSRDHATNQPRFGPDGALYIPQPSNNAVGAPDAFWFMRPERGLSATILRLDVARLVAGQTIDAKTPDAGGSFDPNSGSPLTVYARGLRMPYDLLWHSNGNLYSAINGASSSGATPAGAGVPAIPYVNLAEHDWFFRVEKDHFYGHPNPLHGHYALNGANPTAGPDFNEVSDYPVGTQPDPQWTSAVYDFGMHVSPNGTIEYRSGRFGGALQGKILVCRYNTGSDLLCLGLAPDGAVNYAAAGIPGTTGLTGPLDLIEDLKTGNIYVCEYFERAPEESRITLLRALDRAGGR